MNDPPLLIRAVEDFRGDALDKDKRFQGFEGGIGGLVRVRKRQVIVALRPVEPVQVIGILPVQDGIDDDVCIFRGYPLVDQEIFQDDARRIGEAIERYFPLFIDEAHNITALVAHINSICRTVGLP